MGVRMKAIVRVKHNLHVKYLDAMIKHIIGNDHSKCADFKFKSCHQFQKVTKADDLKKIENARIFLLSKLEKFKDPATTSNAESFNIETSYFISHKRCLVPKQKQIRTLIAAIKHNR